MPIYSKHKFHKYLKNRIIQYHRNKDTIDLLKNYFKDHNSRLESFINRDLSSWNN